MRGPTTVIHGGAGGSREDLNLAFLFFDSTFVAVDLIVLELDLVLLETICLFSFFICLGPFSPSALPHELAPAPSLCCYDGEQEATRRAHNGAGGLAACNTVEQEVVVVARALCRAATRHESLRLSLHPDGWLRGPRATWAG